MRRRVGGALWIVSLERKTLAGAASGCGVCMTKVQARLLTILRVCADEVRSNTREGSVVEARFDD